MVNFRPVWQKKWEVSLEAWLIWGQLSFGVGHSRSFLSRVSLLWAKPGLVHYSDMLLTCQCTTWHIVTRAMEAGFYRTQVSLVKRLESRLMFNFYFATPSCPPDPGFRTSPLKRYWFSKGLMAKKIYGQTNDKYQECLCPHNICRESYSVFELIDTLSNSQHLREGCRKK